MGAATESLIMILGWAGFVSVLFLFYSLFTRVRRGPGNRGVFQRMPLLLPAIAFVISVFVILQMGITPIQDYRGSNIQETFLYTDTEVRFTVYDSGIAYVGETILNIRSELEPEESIDIILAFYLHGNLIDTITIELDSAETVSMVSENRTLDLDPGNYIITANSTFYDEGEIVQDSYSMHMTLSQATLPTIYPELIEWSTYQFMINVGCFFFLIGGLCIGKTDTPDRRVDYYDDKTKGSDEFRTY